MSKVKITGHASGTGVLTVTAPNTSTDRTITLPDATGTLATTDDNGSQLDHSGSKKIEATSTGASVTGVGKFFLENNGGAGGGIVASNTDASNPATGGFLDLMERDVNFGTANNYGVRLYYDGSANKFHIQGGNETTVATHLTMVRDSGDITIDSGDLIFGTAGKGIVLGSTSNTDANTLDDYEQGTWTPTVANGTIGAAAGEYTKIGNFCIATFVLKDFSNKTTTNTIAIRSIPFTQDGTATVGTVIAYQNGQSNPLNLIKGASFDEFNMFYMYNASGWGTQKHNTLGGDPHFYCVVTYKTT